MNGQTYALGIDLGTTSVKAAIVSHHDMTVKATRCRDTHAQTASHIGSLGNEQEVDKILTALQFCLSGLPKELLLKVSVIGVAGQMHGVMLWRSGEGWKRTNRGRFEKGLTSHLYTWQDGRCTPNFLDSLPPHEAHLRVATGQGIPTLFWLQKNQSELVQQFDCAGTIQVRPSPRTQSPDPVPGSSPTYMCRSVTHVSRLLRQVYCCFLDSVL